MNCRLILALCLSIFPMIGFSQIENEDTISIGQNGTETIRLGISNDIRIPDSITPVVNMINCPISYYPTIVLLTPYRLTQSLDLHIPDMIFTPGQARLFNWNSGAITASGGTKLLPGMMQIDSGSLGIYQSVGNFTFYAGGIVNKYGYFNGLHTQYGLNGKITYRVTPRLSTTLFGDYYWGPLPQMANGMPMSPSMAGYYGRSTIGGYLDYQINEHWGVQTGVQSVQQIGTNRYQAEPIVTPYYKISKKVAIGLPVGQILYHVLKK